MRSSCVSFRCRSPKIAVPTRTMVDPSRDGRLEVGRHAHRQGVDVEARSRAARSNSARSRASGARWRAASFSGSGIAIRPRNRSRGSAPTARASATRRRRARHRSCRFAADVDLQQHVETGATAAGRCSDSRCATFSRSIDCTQSNCSAMAACLVALDRPDEVPAASSLRSRSQRLRSCRSLPARSFRRMPLARAARAAATRRPGTSC